MKFSVLLPTKNRLDLLKYALNSVLKQDYDDWEVIIYDNCSNQDVLGYVQSINDSRVKYFRTQSPVTVTENWNNSLEKSSGDYIIMLGDDDCLMKGYFTAMIKLLVTHSEPDFIYASAFLYAYPGVFPETPQGFIHAFGNATFLHKKNTPFWLGKDEALRCVQSTMNFKVLYGFNMQYSLINRKFIAKLQTRGKFFQSPYPDYYATTAMMLNADKILAVPSPMVTIGISPKSFGYYYVNRREKTGVEFLQNNAQSSVKESLKDILLPGTDMNTSWLIAMETVKRNYEDIVKLEINYKRYRLIQIIRVVQDWLLKYEGYDTLISELKKHAKWYEKIAFEACIAYFSLILSISKKYSRRGLSERLNLWVNSHMDFHCKAIEGNFQNINEVFEHLDPTQVKQ